MHIDQIIILDQNEKKANLFKFVNGPNIITSDTNTQGKSCLIKSIFYAIGLKIEKFTPTWDVKKMVFKVRYTHNSSSGYIIRHQDNFWVDSIEGILNEKEYSEWLLKLLKIRIKLAVKKSDRLHDVRAFVPLSLFYIDQDTSWSGAIYRNTINQNLYSSQDIPRTIFQYLLGLSNRKILDLEDDNKSLNTQKSIIENQNDSLRSLKDDFIFENIETTFDEDVMKKEVNQYLDLAQSISAEIKKHKATVYAHRIKLDALELDLNEINKILEYLNKSYGKIEHKCTQCNTQLTPEQSILRMKLNDNKITIEIKKKMLKKNISVTKDEIDKSLSENINFQNEYDRILSLAETKQGKLTLGEYIDEQSKKKTTDIYCAIRAKLTHEAGEIGEQINENNKNLRALKKKSNVRKEQLERAYEKNLIKLKMKFNNAHLDYKFLKFNEIRSSGSVKNQIFLCLYMAYTKILIEYSSVDLPFGVDSIIKDEMDEDVFKSAYEVVEETILLNQNRQSFFVMLKDKQKYLNNENYYRVIMGDKESVLDADKYLELKKEFSIIM